MEVVAEVMMAESGGVAGCGVADGQLPSLGGWALRWTSSVKLFEWKGSMGRAEQLFVLWGRAALLPWMNRRRPGSCGMPCS